MLRSLASFLVLLNCVTSSFSQDRSDARSMVISPHGIVATSQVRASQAGKLYGLNASDWAPSGLTIEYLKSKGNTKMPSDGIDT